MSAHTEAMAMRERAAGHTPGPWRVHLDAVLVQRCDEDGTFSSAIVDCETGSSPSMPQGEREANARLIAAAPELLEAARGIVDGIDDTRPNFIPLMGNRVAHLREAIAKAEGGAS